MPRVKSIASRIAQVALNTLPAEYRFRLDEPRHWAVEQVLWACWSALADHLLDGPPLPNIVQLGQGGPRVPVSAEMWSEFKNELALDRAANITRANSLLSWQLGLRRLSDDFEFNSGKALPLELCGLIVITCHFEQCRTSDLQRSFSFGPSSVIEAVLRHPQPVAFGPVDEQSVYEATCDYVPLGTKQRATMLRPAFSYGYETLRARLRIRSASAPPIPKLTAGLLSKTILSEADEDGCSSRIGTSVALVSEHPASPIIVDGVLSELLDSCLRETLSAGEPLLDSARQRLSDAFERFLKRDGVELIGLPGSLVNIQLPHPAWRLEVGHSENAADGEVDGTYRVQRSGIKVHDGIVLPAIVVPVRRSHV